jgi:hypothetical protein
MLLHPSLSLAHTLGLRRAWQLPRNCPAGRAQECPQPGAKSRFTPKLWTPINKSAPRLLHLSLSDAHARVLGTVKDLEAAQKHAYFSPWLDALPA